MAAPPKRPGIGQLEKQGSMRKVVTSVVAEQKAANHWQQIIEAKERKKLKDLCDLLGKERKRTVEQAKANDASRKQQKEQFEKIIQAQEEQLRKMVAMMEESGGLDANDELHTMLGVLQRSHSSDSNPRPRAEVLAGSENSAEMENDEAKAADIKADTSLSAPEPDSTVSDNKVDVASAAQIPPPSLVTDDTLANEEVPEAPLSHSPRPPNAPKPDMQTSLLGRRPNRHTARTTLTQALAVTLDNGNKMSISDQNNTLAQPSHTKGVSSLGFEPKVCDSCEKHIAMVRCDDCEMNLCIQECDGQMHAPRRMKHHIRKSIIVKSPAEKDDGRTSTTTANEVTMSNTATSPALSAAQPASAAAANTPAGTTNVASATPSAPSPPASAVAMREEKSSEAVPPPKPRRTLSSNSFTVVSPSGSQDVLAPSVVMETNGAEALRVEQLWLDQLRNRIFMDVAASAAGVVTKSDTAVSLAADDVKKDKLVFAAEGSKQAQPSISRAAQTAVQAETHSIAQLEAWLLAARIDPADVPKYALLMRQNKIDLSIVRRLTHELLKEIGIAPLGDRMKIIDHAQVLSPIASPRVGDNKTSFSFASGAARAGAAGGPRRQSGDGSGVKRRKSQDGKEVKEMKTANSPAKRDSGVSPLKRQPSLKRRDSEKSQTGLGIKVNCTYDSDSDEESEQQQDKLGSEAGSINAKRHTQRRVRIADSEALKPAVGKHLRKKSSSMAYLPTTEKKVSEKSSGLTRLPTLPNLQRLGSENPKGEAVIADGYVPRTTREKRLLRERPWISGTHLLRKDGDANAETKASAKP